MRPSKKLRKPRSTRRLHLERLSDRALLAVLGVAPGPGDDAAALFAEAVATANATPEADTIELAAGTYDLASLEVGTISIESDVSIIGMSPTQTQIIPMPGSTVLSVSQSGRLELSNLTLYGSGGSSGAALRVDGDATLNSVAIIGLVDGDLKGELDLIRSTLLYGGGTFEINNSVLVDSVGAAIRLQGDLSGTDDASSATIRNTVISGSAAQAVFGTTDAFTMIDSTVFDNGLGVALIGRSLNVDLSGSTIAGNTNRLGLSQFWFTTSSSAPGLAIMTAMDGSTADSNNSQLTLSDSNVIVGNQSPPDGISDAEQREIYVSERFGGPANDQYPRHLGNQQIAAENIAAVSVNTEVIDGIRFLNSDLELEGVNVDLIDTDQSTQIESRGMGSSRVFWSPTQHRFYLDSAPRPLTDMIEIADLLAPLDAGQVVSAGSAVMLAAPTIVSQNEQLSIAQQNAWTFLNPTSVSSQIGGTVSLTGVGTNFPQQIRYVPPTLFEGVDTLTVRGLDRMGNEVEGTITIDVVRSTGITINVAASELDDQIEVAISTSGFQNLSSFDFDVSFDSTVVKLVDTDFGREFPFLAETRSRGNDRINVSALGGFSRGSDLITLRFERIAPGSANIDLVEAGFSAGFQGQSIHLSGFDQAYYYLSQDDVNRDGKVTARDSLNIVNRLGTIDSEGESGTERAEYQRDYDANGDGVISASDSLRIINRLGRQGVYEGESADQHTVFSASASQHLDPAKAIPSFVGRPGLPIDDGRPRDSVNVTPPTAEQQASAQPIEFNAEGAATLDQSLADAGDQNLFVLDSAGGQIGFGLESVIPTGQPNDLEPKLSLVLFRADGTLIEAYPTATTKRVIGGAISTVPGERIYLRVATTDADTLNYRLELLKLTSSSKGTTTI
ncbi:Dockerin type I repeat protein [Rubripirellula lacrimiformis]|uniref:Dockerin type I repeat protein n=1 Tax=Rubripirellula lacrimiformis TaxID=1930273 RepID=A0A517NCS6_9BACT|nr:dockerin type I domain-containing protein [Rubripirellula lacrimiformis]QDT04930.1 Dockerin type I repeat protein [Rubripirellula lacrimiformis]